MNNLEQLQFYTTVRSVFALPMNTVLYNRLIVSLFGVDFATYASSMGVHEKSLPNVQQKSTLVRIVDFEKYMTEKTMQQSGIVQKIFFVSSAGFL